MSDDRPLSTELQLAQIIFDALKKAAADGYCSPNGGLRWHGVVQGEPCDAGGTLIDGTFDLVIIAKEILKEGGVFN